MSEIEVIGYFAPKGEERTPVNIFVALNEYHDINKKYLVCYAPIGQHGALDPEYLNECERISITDYITASEGLYTPEEYLKGFISQYITELIMYDDEKGVVTGFIGKEGKVYSARFIINADDEIIFYKSKFENLPTAELINDEVINEVKAVLEEGHDTYTNYNLINTF